MERQRQAAMEMARKQRLAQRRRVQGAMHQSMSPPKTFRSMKLGPREAFARLFGATAEIIENKVTMPQASVACMRS
jgi:hypothetical protein